MTGDKVGGVRAPGVVGATGSVRGLYDVIVNPMFVTALVAALSAALAVLVAVAKYVFIHSIDEKTRYNITPKLYALWSGKLLC